ncbi:MAG: chemotaxis protein CheC [Methanoregula sp.]|nr:chemotaxis protein CheC [Methanoregula sp.]
MKDEKGEFTEEQLDFIKEMMNIGAGNAATALEQMLGLKTELKIPVVKKYRQTDIDAMYRHIGEFPQTVTAVLMNLVGQVRGKIIFIVPDKDLVKLISLMEKATPGKRKITTDLDLSVVTEIGSILAGTYLGSLHDFCMLNVYHSIPKIKNDSLKTLLLEQFRKNSSNNAQIVLVFNQFITVTELTITTYILLVPDIDSMDRIAQSLRQAKDKLSVP